MLKSELGKIDYCVGTDIDTRDGEIYLVADKAFINSTGDLLFLDTKGDILLSVAEGNWQYFYRVDTDTNYPVSATSWLGEEVPKG